MNLLMSENTIGIPCKYCGMMQNGTNGTYLYIYLYISAIWSLLSNAEKVLRCVPVIVPLCHSHSMDQQNLALFSLVVASYI